MQTQRIFVLRNHRSRKVLATLECASLTPREAKVPANVNLDGIEAGMVVRPATGPREPDWTRIAVIEDVRQAKTGNSTITFRSTASLEEEKGPSPPKEEDKPEKK